MQDLFNNLEGLDSRIAHCMVRGRDGVKIARSVPVRESSRGCEVSYMVECRIDWVGHEVTGMRKSRTINSFHDQIEEICGYKRCCLVAVL